MLKNLFSSAIKIESHLQISVFTVNFHFWIGRIRAIRSHYLYESKPDVNGEFTNKFANVHLSTIFWPSTLQAYILVEKGIWNPSSLNLHKSSKPKVQKEYPDNWLLKNTEWNKTSTFKLFYFIFVVVMTIVVYGKKTWRRETSNVKQQQRTPQLRPPPQGERTHHHRPPGWQR